MGSFLKSPLLQFLLVGGLLFAYVSWQSGPVVAPTSDGGEGPTGSSSDSTIVVEREALLAYVQLRTQEADAELLAKRFDALSEADRENWIDRYVREEALVREARRLALDRDDDLIRRRLVQKMEFLAEGLVADEREITSEALEAAYRARAEEFREPAILTFSHVFVADRNSEGASVASRSAGGEAFTRAKAILAELNARGIAFDGAGALGDRFLYNRNYVDRTLDEVRSHFGSEMAETLLAAPVDPSRWQGPFASDHGWHLVLLADRIESRVPPLEDVEAALRRDLMREQEQAAREEGLEGIVSSYRVQLGPGFSR